MAKRKPRLPRKEDECIKHVRNFLNRNKDKYKTDFKIIKDTEEHFVPEIGKCVISDAVICDVHERKYRNKVITKMRRVISLEFEEHKQNYSILKDITRCPSIHVPLRKLYYFRPFDAQYWIKIDMDGTPICIPYKYIANNSININDIGAQGQFTSKQQTNMILAASRKDDGKFPDYVIIGWRAIFKEFNRILKSYDAKEPINLLKGN